MRDEAVVVRSWRLESFLELGFDLLDAQALTSRTDIEIRTAERLIRSGASHDVALRILL